MCIVSSSLGTVNIQEYAMQSFNENMPKYVRVLRDGKRKTKPSILDDYRTVVHLARAFMIGANQTEAAAFAGCSRRALTNHIHGNTMVEYTNGRFSEPVVVCFGDLVNLWQAHLGLLAKIVLYQDILDTKSDTKYAWKYLERSEPRGWGR